MNINAFSKIETDKSQAFTDKSKTLKFPPGKPVDPWEHLNEMLENGWTAIVQTKKLRFAVRAFFPLPNGWLECAVDEDGENFDDNIHIVVKQSTPILLYAGKPPFTN